MKPYTEDFRTAINFLNSSNQRIAMFKNYYTAQGVRLRKFGLDMDVRWNATYFMLKHLLPYNNIFLRSLMPIMGHNYCLQGIGI